MNSKADLLKGNSIPFIGSAYRKYKHDYYQAAARSIFFLACPDLTYSG